MIVNQHSWRPVGWVLLGERSAAPRSRSSGTSADSTMPCPAGSPCDPPREAAVKDAACVAAHPRLIGFTSMSRASPSEGIPLALCHSTVCRNHATGRVTLQGFHRSRSGEHGCSALLPYSGCTALHPLPAGLVREGPAETDSFAYPVHIENGPVEQSRGTGSSNNVLMWGDDVGARNIHRDGISRGRNTNGNGVIGDGEKSLVSPQAVGISSLLVFCRDSDMVGKRDKGNHQIGHNQERHANRPSARVQVRVVFAIATFVFLALVKIPFAHALVDGKVAWSIIVAFYFVHVAVFVASISGIFSPEFKDIIVRFYNMRREGEILMLRLLWVVVILLTLGIASYYFVGWKLALQSKKRKIDTERRNLENLRIAREIRRAEKAEHGECHD